MAMRGITEGQQRRLERVWEREEVLGSQLILPNDHDLLLVNKAELHGAINAMTGLEVRSILARLEDELARVEQFKQALIETKTSIRRNILGD